MLDTSVYGKLAEEPEIVEILVTQIPDKIMIYGNDVTRKELRDTPKYVRHAGKNLRILLLTIYSNLIKDHELKQNKLVETLVRDYYKEYRRLGGSFSKRKMMNDFIIVAMATIYRLKDPVFKSYRIFKKELKSQEDFPV